MATENEGDSILTWLKSFGESCAQFLPTMKQFAVSVHDLPHISDADWNSMTIIPSATRKRMRIAIQCFASSTAPVSALRAWLIGINPSYECFADILLTISCTPDDLRFVTEAQWVCCRCCFDIRIEQCVSESVAIPDAVKRRLRDVLGASRVGSAEDNESRVPKLQHHGVPVIDPHWIARTEIVEQLLEQLCSGDTSTVGIVGVAGMGGIGKTTLSVLVARHPKVMERFPDGIYWLTLGDDCKDALPLQKQLASYGGWTDERLKQLQTAAGAVEPLRMAFKGLRCLLILDDVWDDRLARYLMVVDLDAGAKVFISSRNGDVLDRMDAWRYSVDFLSPTDCTHVMLKYSKWSLTTVTELDDKLQLFWKRCGRLALAVAMIGCILSEMTPSVNSLSYIDAQMQSSAGITGTVVDNDKYENVYAVIELSLRMLNDRVQIERLAKSRFRDLAVLAEDAVISVTPTPTIHVNTPLSCVDLWTNHKRADAMDEQTARLVVQKLVQRCLLIQVGEDKYKLHDIVWAYLNATVTSDQERDDICLRLAESVRVPWILCDVMRVVMLPVCWRYGNFYPDIFRFRQRWVQRTECLQWILKDSSLRTDGNHSLCYVEDDDVLQEMIQLRPSIIQEAVQWRRGDSSTVLHLCSLASVVKLLCDAGAVVNALDTAGRTPLYRALRYHYRDDYSVAQQLVECGADVNNVSREHRSGITACYLNPYHGGRHPVVKWLIRLPVIDRRLALSELRTLNLPPERRDLLHDAGWNLSTVAEHHE
eukprot:TRINITY_DN312_c0_g1_i3.p1 TRINITY_DN312_c0_g1~~TRINITY_DN312_c0_g1_i3.p1  ORF type:complete len:764 (+),score=122.40 TRINITY_DN312_c0_g1_i3:77-2368(+)